MESYILRLKDVSIKDVSLVGGKNASIGEMIQRLKPRGVNVPDGFVVTALAYKHFLKENGIDIKIKEILKNFDTKNIKELNNKTKQIRDLIEGSEWPIEIKHGIELAYRTMEKEYGKRVDVAVRSSATAEDLPGASFAGEHETYLNVRGEIDVLKYVKKAMASLFTARATSYRVDKKFDHMKVALSVGVQKMVRSDKASSGVMFTLDTESGFRDAVLINGVYGLGEMIVQGEVIPDEWLVFKKTIETYKPIIHKSLGEKDRKMIYENSSTAGTKIVNNKPLEKNSFVLTNKEVLKLARWGMIIEEHYSSLSNTWRPMDIEWAKDGDTQELYIVQARPETIHAERDFTKMKTYHLKDKGEVVVVGASVGSSIASGSARVIMDVKDIQAFKAGEVLVTDMTDPDWEPIMKIASAIVTDKGGRTSHAAIVSRELGIPAIVGAGLATKKIKTGDLITIDTTSSEGVVLKGEINFIVKEVDIKKIPKKPVKIMVNIATPDTAFEKSFLPHDGVGLAREEFIIASEIGIHPMALINYKEMPTAIKKEIDRRTKGFKNPVDFYVEKLAFGIAKISAAFYPEPVIVRFSDFKTNEYRSLIGGNIFEKEEANPMIGFRGAARYYSPLFEKAFLLEVKAIKKVREEFGLTNTQVMVPFCRTVLEGIKVMALMDKTGLTRSKSSLKKDMSSALKIYMMCEIPSNVILADKFLDIFDGMSIGSNDLTQLILGIDRDSEIIASVGNENDEAVKIALEQVIDICKKRNKYIGICGQAPSDYPDLAKWLVKKGISSISLNPDAVISTILSLGKK